MASNNTTAVLVCLLVCLVAMVAAKPGFYSLPTLQQQQQRSNLASHVRQRFQAALENDQPEKSARGYSADDYEDFPQVPPLLRLSYNIPEEEYFKTPGKRYLGIDIPDYISTGGKADAIKSMSNKMKAMGKK